MRIEALAEKKIEEQLEFGNKRFVIYPAGSIGRLTKEILNKRFGIQELALVDNKRSLGSEGIKNFSELKLIKDDYVLLFSVRNKEIRSELIPGLKTLQRPIVDIINDYSEAISYPIFDFCCPRIEISSVNDEELRTLFERTERQWKKLGNIDPYWSVLTESRFRADKINNDTIEAFYESGKPECSKIVQTLIRNEIIDSEDQLKKLDITEIGCGCGRVTAELCKKFNHVNAYDISEGNMNIAKEHIKNENVNYYLVRSFEEYQNLQKADVVFTILVLQHNVPPIIEYILQESLLSLNTNGVAIFQVPSYIRGYRFSYDDIISNNAVMDMHMLPQKDIFRVIKESGCDLLECYMDFAAGMNTEIISSTYVCKKVK